MKLNSKKELCEFWNLVKNPESEKINLLEKRLSRLLQRQEYLSNHGYWEVGYLKGRISALEEWLYELQEDNT